MKATLALLLVLVAAPAFAANVTISLDADTEAAASVIVSAGGAGSPGCDAPEADCSTRQGVLDAYIGSQMKGQLRAIARELRQSRNDEVFENQPDAEKTRIYRTYAPTATPRPTRTPTPSPTP